MKRTATKRGAVSAVVGVVITVGIGLAWPRERLLPLVAQPIVHIDLEKEYVCWRSEYQLFLTHYRKWSRFFANYTFFLDACHLVQIAPPSPEVNFRDLLDPMQDRENLKLEQAEALVAQYTDKHSVFVMGPPSNYSYTTIALELDTYRTQDRCRKIITESDFHYKAPDPLLKRFLKLPEGARLFRQQVSPQQNAFFYQLNCSHRPPFSAWLHHYVPKFDVKPTFTKELWISRANGQGMREIGYILTYPDKVRNAEDHFEEVQWLPNGKQISFVYHGTLFVVSAEPQK